MVFQDAFRLAMPSEMVLHLNMCIVENVAHVKSLLFQGFDGPLDLSKVLIVSVHRVLVVHDGLVTRVHVLASRLFL